MAVGLFPAPRLQFFGSGIGDVTFHGSGLDDLTAGGFYTGGTLRTYTITIASNPANFNWDDGFTAGMNIPITGAAQSLNHGITITFGATGGHTTGNSWTFVASQSTTPLAGGKVYTYEAGEDDAAHYQQTYHDADANDPHANPITLDAGGYATIFLDSSLTYHIIVTDADGNVIIDEDNIVSCD